MTTIRSHDFGPARQAGAPSVYLQAQLHGNEVHGYVILESLAKRLSSLSRHAFRSAVRVVPVANPYAVAQYAHTGVGMYDVHSGQNWNRIFDWPGAPVLAPEDGPKAAHLRPGYLDRLKAELLRLSDGYDVVVDVHTPEFGVEHLYCARCEESTPTFGIENVIEYGVGTVPSFDQAQIMRAQEARREVVAVTVEIESHVALSMDLVSDWTTRLLCGLVDVGALDPSCAPTCAPARARAPRRGVMKDYVASTSGPYITIATLGRPAGAGDELLLIKSYDAEDPGELIVADSPCVPLCLRRDALAVAGCWAIRVLACTDGDRLGDDRRLGYARPPGDDHQLDGERR